MKMLETSTLMCLLCLMHVSNLFAFWESSRRRNHESPATLLVETSYEYVQNCNHISTNTQQMKMLVTSTLICLLCLMHVSNLFAFWESSGRRYHESIIMTLVETSYEYVQNCNISKSSHQMKKLVISTFKHLFCLILLHFFHFEHHPGDAIMNLLLCPVWKSQLFLYQIFVNFKITYNMKIAFTSLYFCCYYSQSFIYVLYYRFLHNMCGNMYIHNGTVVLRICRILCMRICMINCITYFQKR